MTKRVQSSEVQPTHIYIYGRYVNYVAEPSDWITVSIQEMVVFVMVI